ncbi:MAG TPA: polysaccharide deacetylase family protein [Bacteroidia bacterium]|jgi:peptidoglycan/xylan/chitin deacetylase (PgdA/CDA1 family)
MNFRSATFILLLFIAAIAGAHHFCGTSLGWVLVPVLLYKLLIIYGSSNINSGFYIKAYSNGATSEKIIALTFDDGPNREHTPGILKILREHDVPATFFVIGKNIPGNEELIRKIADEGHLLGNHTYSHSFFIDFKGKRGFIKEISETSDLVYSITGRKMQFFRPPYGVTTPHLAAAARVLGNYVIGWNIRSLDTTNDDAGTIFKRVKEQVKPGAVILFHDTSEKTAAVLKQTLSFAAENGFKVVSTERLFGLKAYGI